MPSLTPLVSTTELAAVNRLLSAIGEAPISDLVASTREDVSLAATLLREASIEVQSLGWKFNTEFGYEIAPSATLAWEGTDGETDTLNVFLPPSGLLSFRLSAEPAQAGRDIIIRKSRTYESGGNNVLVFYDRAFNRDGLPQSTFEFLYIDPTWLVEWEFLPESARRYIVLRAARQFTQQTLGSADIVGFTEQDEARALYALQLEQGDEEDISMLDNLEISRVRGVRPAYYGFYDNRASAGPA